MARRGKAIAGQDNRILIAVMGDEDTVSGFLLTGIGERNRKGEANFFIVDNNTHAEAIEDAFNAFLARPDIAIIMVN